MTYATIATHISPVIHYCTAFLILFVLLPKLLFATSYQDRTDVWLAAYVKMIFLVIISGYILVLTKLYEVPSLIVLFLIIMRYRFMKLERKRSKKTEAIKVHLLNNLFNWLDGLLKFRLMDTITRASNKVTILKGILQQKFSWNLLLEGITLIIIISGSAYLRFYDAFANAAPPMSDSYVTLAWMKQIDARQLFHNGIYPQGFYIYLATLFKFAAVDALYILRYAGPFNSVLFILVLYMVVRKLTGSGFGAIVAAIIFGIYWVIMPLSPVLPERQAATNAQEFAYVFIFPAVYFFINYLLKKRKEDLMVGLLCTAIIGLVDPIAYLLVGLLIGILAVSALLILRDIWKSVVYICTGSILTVVISFVPLGVGLMLGNELHVSFIEHLIDRVEFIYTYPNLTYVDYSALGFMMLLFFYLFRKKNTREDRFVGIFTILTGCSVFILYYAVGTWTQNTPIFTLSQGFWGLTIPFCVGVSISYLFRWVKEKWHFIKYIFVIVLAVLTFILYNPTPIIPYKLEHKENIEQYLKISRDYLSENWMIVSQAEGYNVSHGKGVHMHLGDFLQNYRPEGKAFINRDYGKFDVKVVQDIFIFMEKEVFQVEASNGAYEQLKPDYQRRAMEYKQLSEWVKNYEEAGYPISTYFENENIRIYHLETKNDDPLSLKNSWNR